MTTKAPFPSKKHVNPMDRQGPGDKIISVITYIVYAFFAFVCAYPFYYIIINSISANNLSERGKVLFWPMEIHFKNYERMTNIPGLLDAAKISVLRTVIGTILTVMIAAFLGYMFTRETMWKRKLWFRFVAVTMYFNAGIIPWVLCMRNLGLNNNFWGYIFPMIVQPFYIILCKTYCESVPRELQEAAEIDGAGTMRVFWQIMLPVIKPILATIAIFQSAADDQPPGPEHAAVRAVPVHYSGKQPEGAAEQHDQLQCHYRRPADGRDGDVDPDVRHSGRCASCYADLSVLPAVFHQGHHDRSGQGINL